MALVLLVMILRGLISIWAKLRVICVIWGENCKSVVLIGFQL